MIRVRTTARQAEAATRELRKQLRFATSVALNDTARDAQRAQRNQLGLAFHLRRREWAERNVKIRRDEFATSERLRVTVRMEAPGDRGRSDVLAKFERPGTKRPERGTRLAVPLEAWKDRSRVLPQDRKPAAFRFRHVSGPLYKGAARTFMLRLPGGRGGIFQRVGGRKPRRGERPGRDKSRVGIRGHDPNLRQLYSFTPKARIDGRLRFVETATRTAERRFASNFDRAFRTAIATARPLSD